MSCRGHHAASTQGYRLGARVALPALVEPYRLLPGEPRTRRLWIYTADPANVGLRQPIVRVDVPYEKLKPGPTGALFEVIGGTISEDLRGLLDWSEAQAAGYADTPLDLDDLTLALGTGLAPTTGDPRFAAQMVYAVCHHVYAVFRRALGRNPAWGAWMAERIKAGESTQLRIRPVAFNEANAWYDAATGTITFGYFVAGPTPSPFVLPGGVVFAALSRDIIVHEVTHALLDGMRGEFMRNTHPDVPAFHEAFADIVTLFHHFADQELVAQALTQSHGKVDSDLLLDLGRQFGEAINGAVGGALRRALRRCEGPDTPADQLIQYVADMGQEAHERGSILVAAVFEAFLTVYSARTVKLFRVARATHADSTADLSSAAIDLLAEAACKVAGHFLDICIRAIDYCPPIDVHFDSFLRAMLTADYDVAPEDRYGYRDALIKAFRRRSVEIRNVRDLSEDSLRWRAPQLAECHIQALEYGNLRFSDDGVTRPGRGEFERRARALGDFIVADPARLAAFGLRAPKPPYGEIVIESIRHTHRVAVDGLSRNELVAEVSQARTYRGHTFIGGATVLIGTDGVIRFIIRRRVDDIRRRRAEMRYAGAQGAQRLDFRAIHGRRYGNSPTDKP